MARRPGIPEPEPPPSDPELEQVIADLIARKYAAPKGSAACSAMLSMVILTAEDDQR
jgi:hypothetical protein